MTDERLYWAAFNAVRGIGAVRFRLLVEHFGSARQAWLAPVDALQATRLSPRLVEAILASRRTLDLDALGEQLERQNVTLLTWDDPGYPRRLKEIQQPPPVLYVRGELSPADDLAIGMVGTRHMTPYGKRVCEEVAAVLAEKQVTVVSGLARGVDGAAHATALKHGGRTIAVLGSGVDRIYPPEHRALAEQIAANGAIISDYALGTRPEAINFPPRNRIISGLSLAVVVVEAGETSGALITARFAADQGRDVFAVPGSIYAGQSAGPNRLLRDGAAPLLSPNDLLDALHLAQAPLEQSLRSEFPIEPAEAQLLAYLSQEPLHIDELRHMTNLPVEEVSARLTMMELKGLVQQVGGMNYIALRELPAGYAL